MDSFADLPPLSVGLVAVDDESDVFESDFAFVTDLDPEFLDVDLLSLIINYHTILWTKVVDITQGLLGYFSAGKVD